MEMKKRTISLISSDIISVKPLSGPSETIYTLEYVFTPSSVPQYITVDITFSKENEQLNKILSEIEKELGL